MADRAVTVRFRAENGQFIAGARAAGTSMSEAFTEGRSKAEAIRGTIRDVGIGLLGVGVAAAAGLGQAISTYAAFDQQMSNVQAATHESVAGMGLLRDATLEAAAASQYGAVQAGQGVEELAKAGIATADILGGGLKGALDLAAAGGLAVADSAETMATAMSVFNLEGAQAAHVADLLAAGAGKAQGSVGDMSAALNQSALVANQLGLSVEDTTGVLAQFASAGLLGSDAGTSFRTMLLRLINPTGEAKELMAQLGINTYDASGSFVGMESLAGQLQSKMGGLSEETRNAALATLFGADAIRGATILYDDGAAGVEHWQTAVDDAGYAAETARIRTDNLAGDVERLGGAWESTMIKVGEGANGPLRAGTQLLTDMINVVGEAPAAVQKALLGLGVLATLVGLAGGAAFLAAPKIVAFNTAVAAMRSAESTVSVQRLGGALSGLARAVPIVGGVLGVGAVALGIFSAAHGDAIAAEEELQSALRATKGELDDTIRALVAQSVLQEGLADDARELGLGLDVVTDAAMGQPEAIDAVAEAVGRAKAAYNVAMDPEGGFGDVTPQMRDQLDAALNLEGGLGVLGNRLQGQITEYEDYAEAMRGSVASGTVVTTTLEGIKAASDAAAGGWRDLGDDSEAAGLSAADAATASLDGLNEQRDLIFDVIDAYRELNGIVQSAPEAQGAYYESIRETTAGIAEMVREQEGLSDEIDLTGMSIGDIIGKYGEIAGSLNAARTGFDVTTEAGYALQQMFGEQADAAEEAADRTYELAVAEAEGDPTKLTAARDAYVATLKEQQAQASTMLQGLGLEKDAADALAQSFIDIPDNIETELSVEDEIAKQKAIEQAERLADLERARVARLDANPEAFQLVLAEQEERLTSFEVRRTAQLFGDDTEADATEDDQEERLRKFVERRVVALGANDAEADRIETDQEGRLGLFQQTRTVPLDADPAGAIDGANRAQSAIDGVHGKTVYIDIRERAFGGDLEGLGYGADGGRIGGYSPNDRADNIAMMVTAGEVIIPNDARRQIDAEMGRGFLDSLVDGRVDLKGLGSWGGGVRGGDGGGIGHELVVAASQPPITVQAAAPSGAGAGGPEIRNFRFDLRYEKTGTPIDAIERAARTFAITGFRDDE